MRRASAIVIHRASAASGKRCRRPLRGGHSSSNSMLLIAAGSRSPSTAKASTCLPPAWRTVASGNGTAVTLVPVSSSNSRSAASAGASPGSTMPLGIIHAPASLPRQNGPPGLISRTCVTPPLARKRSTPALCGVGIHHALSCRHRLGDPSAPQQARALISHRGLAGCHAIFRLREAHPFALTRSRYRRRERAHLDADFALFLAEPVPIRDAHRIDRERPAGADDDPRLLGLDAHDIERLALTADVDPPSLPDGEVHNPAMATKHPSRKVDDLARRFGFRPKTLDQRRIIAVRHEADVLAVGL